MTYLVKNLRKDLWLYTREMNDYLWKKNVKFIPGMFLTFPRERFKLLSWELSGKYQGIISLFSELSKISPKIQKKVKNIPWCFPLSSQDTDLNLFLGNVENIP